MTTHTTIITTTIEAAGEGDHGRTQPEVSMFCFVILLKFLLNRLHVNHDERSSITISHQHHNKAATTVMT
jgi:hypothetical protein